MRRSHKNEWSGALVDSWVKFPAIFGLLSTTKTPSTMADDDDDDRGPPVPTVITSTLFKTNILSKL